MQLALPSAAVYCCCGTAHMYEEQISSAVIAMTQVGCEAIWKSSTEQRGMQFALPSAAVHCCCVTAHLYEEQISSGAIAVTQASCEHVLQAALKSGECNLPCPVLQCIAVVALHTCMKSKSPQV